MLHITSDIINYRLKCQHSFPTKCSCSYYSSAMPNPNGLLCQKLCH